ncbi:MAG: tRNA uridine-5-carboxymethylaminomethyl(34) synthesis GTPase MnmE [Treponema sp.]|nr:tRNA uridine-5-carboxymethylaminomethyl(34) synthesis GTPase MnmE [Treponema sp.]
MSSIRNYTPEEPIAAIATALAPSALAIIRTSGKDCIQLVSRIFSRPKTLLNAEGNSLVYGWIEDSMTNQTEKKVKIDEVMLGIYKAPKSFTGEDMVEIFCHGGTRSVLAIYSVLLKNGFRQAEKGEFTFRGFINGKTDLTKAEAIREIIDSRTDAARSRAAGRLSGNLFNQIDEVKRLIIDTVASIEVEIEYPEDEETIADVFNKENLFSAEKKLIQLSKSWAAEKLYQDGARIILCGKTNAGKSSLFNVLLKEERAIVSDIEGTTRDWLESWISFDGIPARLFDTAGLRITDDTIEKRGVEMTKDLSRDADLILYVIDSFIGKTQEDDEFINYTKKEGIPLVIVFNKSDKKQTDMKQNDSVQNHFVNVSAKTGYGIDKLTKLVREILQGNNKTDRQSAGLGSQRQKIAVDEALECVQHALGKGDDGHIVLELPLDAIVQDLENALVALSEITGETSPEDILDSIFSNFCVGK